MDHLFLSFAGECSDLFLRTARRTPSRAPVWVKDG